MCKHTVVKTRYICSIIGNTSTQLLLLLYIYIYIYIYDKLAQTYYISLPYSTSLLNITVIHSRLFCALNFTFAQQAVNVYFYSLALTSSNFQLPNANY